MRKIVFLVLPLLMLFSGFALAETESLSIMGNLMGMTVVLTSDNNSTLLKTATDAALVSAGGSAANWDMVRAVMITAESYDARISFGRAASRTVGHILPAGTSMRIPSKTLLNKAYFTSKTAGAPATLQVTLEF